MKQRFAAFDIDGTLFRGGLYRDLAFELIRMGYVEPGVAKTIQKKHQAWLTRSHEESFDDLDLFIAKEIDKALLGLPAAQYRTAVARVVQKRGDEVYLYTHNLITHLKAKGYMIIAISNSTDELVRQFAVRHGFDVTVGRKWEIKNNRFTGNLLVGSQPKDKILAAIVEQYNLTYAHSYAVGDTSSDACMLELVKHPIAFNPTSNFLKIANRKGWQVVVERKGVAYILDSKRISSQKLRARTTS